MNSILINSKSILAIYRIKYICMNTLPPNYRYNKQTNKQMKQLIMKIERDENSEKSELAHEISLVQESTTLLNGAGVSNNSKFRENEFSQDSAGLMNGTLL